MALGQLRAFREGREQESLGPTERLEPDGFPLLASSELRAEHEKISTLLPRYNRHGDLAELGKSQDVLRLLAVDGEARTRLYLALIERIFAHDAKLGQVVGQFDTFFDYGPAARVMALLFDAGVDVARVAEPTLEWFNCYRFVYYGTEPVMRVVDWVTATYAGRMSDFSASLREKLIGVRGQCTDLGGFEHYGRALVMKIDAILGDGPWNIIVPSEAWAAEATTELETLDPKRRQAWLDLLRHCGMATSARPTPKWTKTARSLLDAVGRDTFRAAVLRWFGRADAGRRFPMVGPGWQNVDERQRMHEVNATVLRGLLWLCPEAGADAGLARAVAKLAVSAYRKIRGIGPRAPKVGNACVYALSAMNSQDAVGQLAVLKVKVKFGTAQKEIEKAFDAAATALGLPRDQIEELGVPTCGMEEVGLRRETLGEMTAELRVGTEGVETVWLGADRKPRKAPSAKVKTDFKEELNELKTAAKDLATLLPAQGARLDSMFLLQKRWPLGVWRERYLDHPLVGTLARRLIWTIDQGKGNKQSSIIWHDGRLVDADDRPVTVADHAQVALWHPIGRPLDEAMGWRGWLERHGVRQPFKQAHREVYLLTDAERRTGTYSNRFAAHVLRQHQFNALCAARGWKNKLRLMVDDSFPPATRELPQWSLRAEFWIEGIGEDYGTDTNESGVFLRVGTDQVRFYRGDAAANLAHGYGGAYETDAAGPGRGGVNEPLALEEVHPLVFSEVMRDVDLFVGVASVGNDPTWQDGGPGGRYREYWQSVSFGALGETAKTRRAVLEQLLPRLTRLKDRWRLDERFLVIRGDVRTYKIHLGSSNILMEPNDQYLCIVPDQSARRAAGGGDVFLPFEGDQTLSVILSKAFLLAADKKIIDQTITRQIAQ